MRGSPVSKPESTTRARWASSRPGFGRTRTAWTIWSGCAGRRRSSARTAGARAGGDWLTDGFGARCGERTSPTAGTIFDRTRTPLTVWFMACWLFATQKDGISALSLKRSLEIGSYQTAWAMLHRLRSVLVRPGRERLQGDVEVDETFIGGEEPGLRGGRQKGKKMLVGVAVERYQPKGFGRCRMAAIADASGGVAARVPGRPRRTGRQGDHRRLGGLPGRDQGPYLHEPLKGASAGGRIEAAARRAQGLFTGQALAARHPPGLGRRGAPGQLPRRVRVPLQPPQLPQPRAGLLPRARTRRRPRARPLPRPHRQPQARHGTRDRRPRRVAGPRAWNAHPPTGPGEPRRPPKWIPHQGPITPNSA